MQSIERHLQVVAILDNVREACQFVSQTAQQAGMGEDGVFECDLSVEEIMTNIIEHGYKHKVSDDVIDVVCRYNLTVFTIEIIDSAPPFNPLTLATPNFSPDLEDLKAGGVGVHFVNQYMDATSYEYRDGKNHFMMRRRIP